jgi:hypothetical protein
MINALIRDPLQQVKTTESEIESGLGNSGGICSAVNHQNVRTASEHKDEPKRLGKWVCRQK